MPDLDLPKILEKYGINSESLHKIHFGQGVVGKSSLVAIAACATIAFIASRFHGDWFLASALAAIVIGFPWYIRKITRFAKKNPELALMEGATLLAWKQTQLAAKEIPEPPNEPLISNPQESYPALSHSTEKAE